MAVDVQQRVNIIDIRQTKLNDSLLQLMVKGLNPGPDAEKTMPTLLLYDERGLKIFEEITYLEEYYLTNTEIAVLEKYADQIAERVPEGSRLVELGSGNLRKVDLLLRAFERARKSVAYYALDLSLSELERTFSEIPLGDYHYVKLNGLHGTYDDGLSWLSNTVNPTQPTCVMSLGSSLGNFSRDEAARFLRSFTKTLTSSDILLIGLDACQDPERVHRAYNDSKNVTHQFYRNGLDHANELLGFEAFKQQDWDIVGHYDEINGRHEAFYQARKDLSFSDVTFQKGEKLKLEDAYKYSTEESNKLWHDAGLVHQSCYTNERGDYGVHLLSPAKVACPTKPREYAPHPVPSLTAWQELWTAWDTVTRTMIPTEELLEKPIKLRNNLIFYLGHIPTFADIHMTRATAGKPTHPTEYVLIFERGIDPDVDNPELCHTHSEIPDAWPQLGEILDYQVRVRRRIRLLTKDTAGDRTVGRALWLAFEHEAMHLETFLYMLLQSEKLMAPPGLDAPDFEDLADIAARLREPNQWHHVPASKLTLGLDDAENDLGPDRFFGWDIERPKRIVAVHEFEAQARPITNGDFARFLEMKHSTTFPSSWCVGPLDPHQANGSRLETTECAHHSNDVPGEQHVGPSRQFLQGKCVRTVYGAVPLKYALDWPVMASYDELASYAKWAGGRIPTLEEARSIYNYVELLKDKAENIPSSLISAVNGHLSNNGVEESPPQDGHLTSFPAGKLHPDPDEIYINLDGCNIGFKSWTPVPITDQPQRLRGQSDMGGVWEWTSTPLAAFEGYKPMDLYPGYSSDFFDDKHNIVLGGSWATHSRLAGRKTFVNWYQRNYPFVWAGARLVRAVRSHVSSG